LLGPHQHRDYRHSSKHLRCRFERQGRHKSYRGTMSKFGIDLGSTGNTVSTWAVLAPTANAPPRSLSGDYGGIGAQATAGYGVGANALIGGSRRGIVCSPEACKPRNASISPPA